MEVGDWLGQNFELRKDFTLTNCQIHQTAGSNVYVPSTNECDEDDFDYGGFVDRANERHHVLQTGSSTPINPQHNHGRTHHGLKQVIYGKVFGNIGGGHLNTKRVIPGKQMGTADIFGDHHDTYLLKAIFQPLLSRMSKRAEEAFATSTGAKQKPVQCTGLIAGQISDKYADMDHHAVPSTRIPKLEATQA